ncbi:uncharacterized protein [Magallana gigas]|uniref:uncharacterized protein isoform X1 n=1 Tax=Magallana gigas TaxID=29159 RepID=UPI00333E1DE2
MTRSSVVFIMCILIHWCIFTVLASSCSVNEFDIAADNAVITCMTNVSCEAECYRGYIYPNGRTNESYICQDGLWTPVISTCKPIPEVSVKYAVTWVFSDVLPYICQNITAKFNNSKELLEEAFASLCKSINRTIFFTYSTLSFTITAKFTATYNNFTNWNVLEKCKTLTITSFANLSIVKTIFENVSCGESNLNHTILKELFIEDSHEQCSNGREIHSVTSSDGTFEVYCDFNVAETTTEMNKELTTASIMSMLTNTSSTTGTTKLNTIKTPKVGLVLKSIIYIAAAAAGGIILVSIITICLVCHKKRNNSLKRLPGEINMKYSVNHQGYNCGFKGEMNTNEFYKSADDVTECQNGDVTQSSLESYSAAPYYNLKMTYSKLEPEEDLYSYASKF